MRERREFAEHHLADFENVMDVNYKGMFYCVRAEINAMKEQESRILSQKDPGRGVTRGTIVNLGSLASYTAMPGNSAYVTSKHAVLGLTKNAGELLYFSFLLYLHPSLTETRGFEALDTAKYSIRINCLCPSFVDTPMVRSMLDARSGARERIEKMSPMGRMAQPGEIADVAIFLSSTRSSYVTGVGWVVAGGGGTMAY